MINSLLMTCDIFQVGHKTAMSLATRLKKLINLDLSWCRNLTEEDFGLIVDGCLSLRVLKAFGCTQVCIPCQTLLLVNFQYHDQNYVYS